MATPGQRSRPKAQNQDVLVQPPSVEDPRVVPEDCAHHGAQAASRLNRHLGGVGGALRGQPARNVGMRTLATLTRRPDSNWNLLVALVVEGQVRHTAMPPAAVREALRRHIPELKEGGFGGLERRRPHCEITLTPNDKITLDFAISSRAGELTPAEVTLLVREAESLHASLRSGLRRRMRNPKLKYCFLEDQLSRNNLLSMTEERPLSSSGAWISYVLSVLLIVVALLLALWQFKQPGNAFRNYNMVSFLIGLLPSALTLPLPFVWEWCRSRGRPKWHFPRVGSIS